MVKMDIKSNDIKKEEESLWFRSQMAYSQMEWQPKTKNDD